LADPVFDASDERIAAGKESVVVGTTRGINEGPTVKSKVDEQVSKARYDLERAFNLQPSGDASAEAHAAPMIPRLPFTRREAAAIGGASRTGAVMQALDFDASRATATSDKLSQYRYIHFATHGILNSEHPELSGIVLSLVDEKGQPQDGFLRLHEIYNLKLGAELVVLSACQTALGKDVKGEGLIGLTRGFMYAGSPRVMASLWKVDDVATSELMGIFYRKVLRVQKPLPPAAALREAQIEMWKNKRWSEPYYWAAFQLQGEWR
jgi:CHAT domain-containing protein